MISLRVISLLALLRASFSTRTLLVVLDGFRYDYVKLFTTPNLERLTTKDNSFFHPGVLPVFPGSTLPNLASLLTGNFSDTTGVTNYRPQGDDMKQSLSPSSREYWDRLRGMGTIWDAYMSSPETERPPPGLIDWPYSVQMDSQKNPHLKHTSHSTRNLSDKFTQIKKMFNNNSLEFVSVYVDEPGIYAIPYGPESRQVNESITRLDNWIGDLTNEFQEDTNIIIASTPGYLNASLAKAIYLNKILKDGTYSIHGASPFLSIVPNEGEEIDIFRILNQEKDFKTYSKSTIPPEWHFKLESKVKIVLLANEGRVFEDFFAKAKRFQSKHRISEPLERTYGLNGYADDHQKTRSILLGVGPAFAKEGSDAPSAFERKEARIVDVYALLLHVLGLKEDSDREGRLEPFLQDLSNPPKETLEKIKAVLKRISNTPAAGAIGGAASVLIVVLLCVILLYRRRSKNLDHSYSYTQIRDNRRASSDQAQEEDYEKVEFLGMEEEFHEAEEGLLPKESPSSNTPTESHSC